jgi:hypothetical protein
MNTQEYKDLFYAKQINEVLDKAAKLWTLARNSRNVLQSFNGIDEKAKEIAPNFIEYTKISATLTRFSVRLDDGICYVEIKNNANNGITFKQCTSSNDAYTLIKVDAPTNLKEIVKVKEIH